MKNLEKEVWKDIPGYEGLYQASNKSRFRDSKGLILKKQIDRCYFQLQLSKNGIKEKFHTHRLLAIMFVPNPENLKLVEHKDDNGFNDSIDNLMWSTYSNNVTNGYYRSSKHKIKSVKQYDKNGNFINEFESIALAGRSLGDSAKSTNISSMLAGRCKTAYGFIWKYSD